MSEQIKIKITESLENFETARKIAQTFTDLSNTIGNIFYCKLQDKITSGKIESKYGLIEYFIQEDEDPLYFGIKLKDTNDKVIKDNEEFNQKIADLIASFPQNNPGKNFEDHLGWNVWLYLSKESCLYQNPTNNLSDEEKFRLLTNLENEVVIAYDQFSAMLEKTKLLFK